MCVCVCSWFLCDPQGVRAPSAVRWEPPCPCPTGLLLRIVCLSTHSGGYWPRRSRDSLSLSSGCRCPSRLCCGRNVPPGRTQGLALKALPEGRSVFTQLEALWRTEASHVGPGPSRARSPGARRPYVPVTPSLNCKALFATGPWESLMAVQRFITSLIALNSATLPECLARLGKLSTEHFVIKFSIMSSGGTRSVKFEITPGHFLAEPEPTLKLETWKKMPWGRCSLGALQLNGCGDISPAINSGLCSTKPCWICRAEPFWGFDLHLCIYSTGGLVLLGRKCLFNSLPYLFKIARADSNSKFVWI